MIKTGCVPVLLELLRAPCPTIVLESAWSLSNIASGSSRHTQYAVDQGLIEPFLELLSHPDPEIREHALWGLSNVAGEPMYCGRLLKAGILNHALELVPSVDTCEPSLLRNLAWLFSNLCRGKPKFDFTRAIPLLARMLMLNDVEMQADVCWAFAFLSDSDLQANPKTEAIVASGVVPRLIELLPLNKTRNTKVLHAALRTLGR